MKTFYCPEGALFGRFSNQVRQSKHIQHTVGNSEPHLDYQATTRAFITVEALVTFRAFITITKVEYKVEVCVREEKPDSGPKHQISICQG